MPLAPCMAARFVVCWGKRGDERKYHRFHAAETLGLRLKARGAAGGGKFLSERRG